MGSEMCIRDSSIVLIAASELVFAAVITVSAAAVQASSGFATATNCLLYTSDAADDLHCVDLGGRRIIKKKTTDGHYTTHHPHAHNGYSRDQLYQ